MLYRGWGITTACGRPSKIYKIMWLKWLKMLILQNEQFQKWMGVLWHFPYLNLCRWHYLTYFERHKCMFSAGLYTTHFFKKPQKLTYSFERHNLESWVPFLDLIYGLKSNVYNFLMEYCFMLKLSPRGQIRMKFFDLLLRCSGDLVQRDKIRLTFYKWIFSTVSPKMSPKFKFSTSHADLQS